MRCLLPLASVSPVRTTSRRLSVGSYDHVAAVPQSECVSRADIAIVGGPRTGRPKGLHYERFFTGANSVRMQNLQRAEQDDAQGRASSARRSAFWTDRIRFLF